MRRPGWTLYAAALVLSAAAVGGVYLRDIEEKWDTALTVSDTTANSQLIIVSSAGGQAITVTAPSDASLTFLASPADTYCGSRTCTLPMCTGGPCGYTCRFTAGGVTNVTTATVVAGSSNKQLSCPAPAWGADKPAGAAVLTLYKGDARVENRQLSQLSVYFEEDIRMASPSTLNAAGQAIDVYGSGFNPSKVYHCATFASAAWLGSSATAYPGLQAISQPMQVLNNTNGRCLVASAFSSEATARLTLLRESAAYNAFSGSTGVRQPLIASVSANSLNFDSAVVAVTHSWSGLSSYSGLASGGDTVTVLGAGFNAGTSYECEFSVAAQTLAAAATFVSSASLTCVAPPWTPSDGNALFRVRQAGGGALVTLNQATSVFFMFLRAPQWNTSTVAEGGVYLEGVNCISNKLYFQADAGGSELRMTLTYTPLRPKPGASFAQRGGGAPSLADVLRGTERLQTATFLQGAMVDTILPDGRPSLSILSHTLQLPEGQVAERVAKGGERVRAPDNTQQPSELNLTAVTQCGGVSDSVCGTLVFNVSRGWEGYAYEVCVTARHAIVQASQATSAAFASRCVYYVVPKCRKCYTQHDTLHAIAASYGSTWLDLWSVNPHLSNTTAPSSADEVGGTPGDQVYIRVPLGGGVNMGTLYTMRGEDTTTAVARRFGMTLQTLMALNPDIVAANQDLAMTGKSVCILQTAKAYDKCPGDGTVANNPVLWDKILGYDARGAAIKVWNQRWPKRPDTGSIPRHG